jgi:hypothetical protein
LEQNAANSRSRQRIANAVYKLLIFRAAAKGPQTNVPADTMLQDARMSAMTGRIAAS